MEFLRIAAFIFLTMPAAAQTGTDKSTATVAAESPAPAKINEQEMALKAGQLVMLSIDSNEAEYRREAIEKGLVGGVLLQWGDYSLEQTADLIKKLQSWAKKSPTGTPLLVAVDYEGGTVFAPVTLGLSNLPTNMMIGAAGNETNCASLAYLAGLELKKTGIHINFAPVLDVNTNINNPIIGVRSFGSDPDAVSRLGTAFINGIQTAGIMAVAKHFPGHGDAHVDSHVALPILDVQDREMKDIHLKPFEAAIKDGVGGIMTAHVLYKNIDPENPATFSRKIVTELLKKELGFGGVVFSDSLDMKGATEGKSISKAAIMALKAGVDMDLIGKANPAEINARIVHAAGKELPVERINDAYDKIMALKKKLGLFEDKPAIPLATDKAYQFLADEIARNSVTLVYNNGSVPAVMPQNKSSATICAVFFSPPRFYNDAIEMSKPLISSGWTVTQYNAPMIPKEKDLERARQCARNSSLLVLGTFQWAAVPYASQMKAVTSLLSEFRPSVIVSLMSPYDARFYPQAGASIITYGINKFSMRAVGEVINGNLKPTGMMPFPKEQLQNR